MPQLLLAWFVRDTRAGWYNGTSLDVLQCYINMQDMLLRLLFTTILVPVWPQLHQERPYNHDSTASRLLSEVKHDLARLVLRWGTTLESLVLFFFFLSFFNVGGWCYKWVIIEKAHYSSTRGVMMSSLTWVHDEKTLIKYHGYIFMHWV